MQSTMDARMIARAGLAAALLAVSAWVSIPLGPVPFTLQTMVLAILPIAFDRPTALVAVGCYLLLGAIGLPVFAGFGAGLGTLMGPTGGFLWGFFLGTLAATSLVALLPRSVPALVCALTADVMMLAISYACGTVQLMAVMGIDPAAALALAVLPFIVPDAVKLAVGASIGLSVRTALAGGMRTA